MSELSEQNKKAAGSPQQYQHVFTVFTPTYNRAYTLHRVYKSLEAQTFRDFEWLVIDDGSTDNTRKLVEEWQKTADFPVRYIYQENSGKHVAHNLAVREARGELFLPFDSDDQCAPRALERFNYHWNSIPQYERPEFCGVYSLCVDQYGKLVGGKFPQDVTDSNLIELRYKYRVRGEKWPVLRTDVLRQFPFPAVEGYRSYVPEGVVWYAFDQKFKARFVNEPLRTYWHYEIGRSDQVSSPHPPSKHAAGLALWHQTVLNRSISWFRYAPATFLSSAAHYTRFSLHAGKGLLAQLKQLDNALARALWAVTSPIGLILYWKDPK